MLSWVEQEKSFITGGQTYWPQIVMSWTGISLEMELVIVQYFIAQAFRYHLPSSQCNLAYVPYVLG